MSSISEVVIVFLCIVTVCTKCDTDTGIQPIVPHATLKEHSTDIPSEKTKFEEITINLDNSSSHQASGTIGNDKMVILPIGHSKKDIVNYKPTFYNEDQPAKFALEGGEMSQQTNFSHQAESVSAEEQSHSKGSKGRKGVQFPGASIVPRKGAPVALQEVHRLNSSTISVNDYNQSTVKSLDTILSNIETTTLRPNSSAVDVVKENSLSNQSTVKIIHSKKKPEIVTDLGDVDDFSNYSIIKTSTTGEDYVIIGIVIVIGIWFSVFGALIFYRRAGEYWDRRHYRRMDFLVEGMYND